MYTPTSHTHWGGGQRTKTSRHKHSSRDRGLASARNNLSQIKRKGWMNISPPWALIGWNYFLLIQHIFLSKRDTLNKSDQWQQEEQNFLNTFRFHGVTHYSKTVFHRKKQIIVAPFTERSENPREKQRKLQRPRKKVYFWQISSLFETDRRPLKWFKRKEFRADRVNVSVVIEFIQKCWLKMSVSNKAAHQQILIVSKHLGYITPVTKSG